MVCGQANSMGPRTDAARLGLAESWPRAKHQARQLLHQRARRLLFICGECSDATLEDDRQLAGCLQPGPATRSTAGSRHQQARRLVLAGPVFTVLVTEARPQAAQRTCGNTAAGANR